MASIDDGKANALTFDLVDSLRAVVASAAGRVQPLLLTGRDGCFSAGFDLAVMNGDDPDRAAALFAAGGRLYRDIVEAPVPVVVSCTGHALAGGAILLLCADHRVGRSGPYKVGLNEVGIGMALPAFAVSIATHRLERRYLTSATMFAEVGDPERAAAVGFLDEVVADPFPPVSYTHLPRARKVSICRSASRHMNSSFPRSRLGVIKRMSRARW